ncbi:MAG: T9SS type A sorting domain-containing protein [Muribaculaceae bacterium]|jgi:hypothetical protein
MQYYYSDVFNTSVSGVEAEYGVAFSDNTIYSLAGDSLNVTVFDISGKKVAEAAGCSVSLSHLAKGVYVVKAEMPGVTKSLKVRIR